MRPKGPGLYERFNLPANNRIDNPLKRTHKEPYALPAQPDAAPLALAIMRKARELGVGPMETLRRHLDAESAATARRLAELTKR